MSKRKMTSKKKKIAGQEHVDRTDQYRREDRRALVRHCSGDLNLDEKARSRERGSGGGGGGFQPPQKFSDLNKIATTKVEL